MEEMTIVRFCVDKEKRGKAKRWGEWQYFVAARRVQVGTEYINLLQVDLPGFVYKKKVWTQKSRTRYLQRLDVPAEDERTYYLLEQEAGEFLDRENKLLPTEFVRLFLQSLRMQFDVLVWLWDGDFGKSSLIEQYVRHTRYIGAVTSEDCLEEWQEELWEEYGFLLEVAEDVTGLHVPKTGRQLWIAGKELYGLKPGMLTQETIFLSTEVDGTGKNVCARAKDAKYLDIKCFLESLFP